MENPLNVLFPKKESVWKQQVLPIVLTVVTCGILVVLLYLEISLLNLFTHEKIVLRANPLDIAIGLTIYLKTSIDFAIYIGNMMARNNNWQSRIAIEIGTALGNAGGTFAILLLWDFFREIHWLMVIMISIAALVLFKLAEDGLEHAQSEDKKFPAWFQSIVTGFERVLKGINRFSSPILKYIIPHVGMKSAGNLRFWSLFGLAFSVPFILGLDDFAGYVPLFNIVNVFGFAIGVFLGHMVLNILLYISPAHTIRAVKNPVISFLGSIVFVLLALWGLYEAVRLLGFL